MARLADDIILTTGERITLDIAALVATDITLQVPYEELGHVYHARILEIDGIRMVITPPLRTAGPGTIRSGGPVIVSFVMADALYETPAELDITDDGMAEIVITGAARRISRRRFARLPLEANVAYAVVTEDLLRAGDTSCLDWRPSSARDLSAGGILLQIAEPSAIGAYLLLDLAIESFCKLPPIVGQVRWTGTDDIARQTALCGVMFIVQEDFFRHFSRPALAQMPAVLGGFNRKKQNELEASLSGRSGRTIQRRS
jgi:hypothetical protein